MLHALRTVGAIGGWTLTVAMMVEGSIDPSPNVERWALLLALLAWIPTMCLILEHHRKRDRAAMKAHVEKRIRAERERSEALIHALALEFAKAELPRVTSAGREGTLGSV